jgi:hypothetical protein
MMKRVDIGLSLAVCFAAMVWGAVTFIVEMRNNAAAQR